MRSAAFEKESALSRVKGRGMNCRESLQAVESALQQIGQVAPEQTQQSAIEAIFKDLRSSDFSVVVVGEFNRGKSTLVNGLLGEPLLPCDVVPTTAKIHKIGYSAVPRLQVHFRDGRVEEEAVSVGQLRRFVAGSDLDAEQVDFVEVGLAIPDLEGFCVVDTPGVNDLNSHRCDVTYSFVPRADAVVFLLDVRSPVRRSEVDFLQSCITTSGIERVIFVANFADAIEPEEHQELELFIRNRLRTALGGDGFSLILMSAKQELAFTIDSSTSSESTPGLNSLKSKLSRLRESGSLSESRVRQFARRGYAVGRSVMNTLIAHESAAVASVDGLRKALIDLDAFGKAHATREREVLNYVSDRRQELLAMVRKSLQTLEFGLQAKAREAIEAYSGPQFHELVGNRIPAMVRKELKCWIESHSRSMQQLVKAIEHNVCEALSRSYQTVITPGSRGGSLPLRDASMEMPPISAEDLSYTNVKAGFLTGGAAFMLSLIGLGPLVAIVGMAGLPLIGRYWHDKKLKEAKAKALDEVPNALTACLASFSSQVLEAISGEIDSMTGAVQDKFKQLVTEATAAIRKEIESRTSTRIEDAARLDKIRSAKKHAEVAMQQLLAMTAKTPQEEQAA
jgi:GTP-binding protein EngB required for normal cell division